MKHKEYRKLNAQLYELISATQDHSEEIDFWARKIEEAGEPVLELGSGTGRVFIPLLERGFDIIGLDNSEDMTTRCLAVCEAKGLKVEIHEQSMVEFDLPRKFGLIMLNLGGLGLFVEDRDIHSVFERVMAHLKPGGMFIYNFELVPTESDMHKNQDRWIGNWHKGSGDVVLAWRRNDHKYNATTHVWERLLVVEKFVDGRLIETEVNERSGRFFTMDEAKQYAKFAGFIDIKMTNRLTDDPLSDDFDGVGITVQCKNPVHGSE